MSIRSTQGPVLRDVVLRSAGAGWDRADAGHHHLVWPEGAAAEVGGSDFSSLVSRPFGLWVPAGTGYRVDSASPVWVARWVAASCPAAWQRRAQFSLAEVAAPSLVALARRPGAEWAPALASAVVDHLQDALTRNPTPVTIPTDDRARLIAEALMADPMNSWELADWAVHVGASERTLRRLFRDETGLTFAGWRMRIRLQTAMRLLQDGMAVGAVARRCGYRSHQSFTRAFRAEYGCTPSEFADSSQSRDRDGSDWPLALRTWPPGSNGASYADDPSELASAIEGDPMLTWARTLVLPVLAMVLLAAACGDDDGDEADGAGSSAPTTTSEPVDGASTPTSEPTASGSASATESAAETRTFIDVMGNPVEIPVRPERIIVDNAIIGGRLHNLGGNVVGVGPMTDGIRAELEQTLGFDLTGVEVVGNEDGTLNIEAVAAVAPDLIVLRVLSGSAYNAAIYDQLSEIAPVVGLEGFQPLEQSVNDVAELLGEAATVDVDAQRQEFETALGELRAVLGDAWSEVEVSAFFDYGGATVWVLESDGQPHTDLLRRVGVSWNDRVLEADEADANLETSNEFLGQLGGDLVVINSVEPGVAPVTEEPVFAALPAAEASQVIVLDQSFQSPTYTTYTAVARYFVEQLERFPDFRTDLVN